jgi:phosphohistidine swiveling domain-containing protein
VADADAAAAAAIAADDRAQLRIARAALRYLGSQLERVQALLVSEGNVDEAAAVLQDLLEVPGVSGSGSSTDADEQVDAALLRAGEAVPR